MAELMESTSSPQRALIHPMSLSARSTKQPASVRRSTIVDVRGVALSVDDLKRLGVDPGEEKVADAKDISSSMSFLGTATFFRRRDILLLGLPLGVNIFATVIGAKQVSELELWPEPVSLFETANYSAAYIVISVAFVPTLYIARLKRLVMVSEVIGVGKPWTKAEVDRAVVMARASVPDVLQACVLTYAVVAAWGSYWGVHDDNFSTTSGALSFVLYAVALLLLAVMACYTIHAVSIAVLRREKHQLPVAAESISRQLTWMIVFELMVSLYILFSSFSHPIIYTRPFNGTTSAAGTDMAQIVADTCREVNATYLESYCELTAGDFCQASWVSFGLAAWSCVRAPRYMGFTSLLGFCRTWLVWGTLTIRAFAALFVSLSVVVLWLMFEFVRIVDDQLVCKSDWFRATPRVRAAIIGGLVGGAFVLFNLAVMVAPVEMLRLGSVTASSGTLSWWAYGLPALFYIAALVLLTVEALVLRFSATASALDMTFAIGHGKTVGSLRRVLSSRANLLSG